MKNINITIGDKVKLNPNFMNPGDNEYIGIVEDIFFKKDRKFCIVYWNNEEFRSTILIHDLVKINLKTKQLFKSIW